MRSFRLPVMLLCWSLSCSTNEIPLAEVTGEVTFNGRPAYAEVIFEPVAAAGGHAGRPSTAMTRPDGSFRLQYTAERWGAVIGRHRVTVNILRSYTKSQPVSFHEAVTPVKVSRMDREVADGKNHFPFAVTF